MVQLSCPDLYFSLHISCGLSIPTQCPLERYGNVNTVSDTELACCRGECLSHLAFTDQLNRPHNLLSFILIPGAGNSICQEGKKNWLLLKKLICIPLDSLACLASVAVETRWAFFKGQHSSGEAVAQPCQNHQSTEKRSKGGKRSKEPAMEWTVRMWFRM